MTYLASNINVTLKCRLGIVQGHWSAIVSTALSSIVLSYLTFSDITTLKSRWRVTQNHWKCHHWTDCIQASIRFPL